MAAALALAGVLARGLDVVVAAAQAGAVVAAGAGVGLGRGAVAAAGAVVLAALALALAGVQAAADVRLLGHQRLGLVLGLRLVRRDAQAGAGQQAAEGRRRQL